MKTLGTKVRIRGNKNWGGFHGEIVDIKPTNTAEVAIPALGRVFHVNFKLNELKEIVECPICGKIQ